MEKEGVEMDEGGEGVRSVVNHSLWVTALARGIQKEPRAKILRNPRKTIR